MTPSRRTRSSVSAGWKWSTSDTAAPASNAKSRTTFKPKTWKNGSTPSATSSPLTRKPGWPCSCSRLASNDPCVSLAAFGGPAVPAVNSSTARSLAARGQWRARLAPFGRLGVEHQHRRPGLDARSSPGGPGRHARATRRPTPVRRSRARARSPARAPPGSAEPPPPRPPTSPDTPSRTRARCPRSARRGHPARLGPRAAKSPGPSGPRSRRGPPDPRSRPGPAAPASLQRRPAAQRPDSSGAEARPDGARGTWPRSVRNFAQESRRACRWNVIQDRGFRSGSWAVWSSPGNSRSRPHTQPPSPPHQRPLLRPDPCLVTTTAPDSGRALFLLRPPLAPGLLRGGCAAIGDCAGSRRAHSRTAGRATRRRGSRRRP